MNLELPPLRERTAARVFEWAGAWAPVLVVAGSLLVLEDRNGDGLFRGYDREAPLVVALGALFLQPIWLGVPWLFRLWSRARGLVEPGRRADLYLASVPAEGWLRRALGPSIRRCLVGFGVATATWALVLALFFFSWNEPPSKQDLGVSFMIVLVFVAEQAAAAGLVLLGVADLMARRLRAGTTSSMALATGLYALGLILGPFAFLLFSVWVVSTVDGGSLFILPMFAWGFAALLVKGVAVRRARVLERYYQFD